MNRNLNYASTSAKSLRFTWQNLLAAIHQILAVYQTGKAKPLNPMTIVAYSLKKLYCMGVILIPLLIHMAPSYAQDNLPNLGRDTSTLSDLDEEKLGRSFIRTARKNMKFIEDPELTHYLTALGNLIARNGDEPDSIFHFYLIDNEVLNAFAVPGGHIAVNTGLIMATESEAELASVLAHEVVHVTQHHLARMLSRAQDQKLPLIAAVVAAVLLGGEAGQAALVAANANAIENRLEYSRIFEREADGIGIQILVKAGFDARAMPSFFERLQRWSRVYDSNAPEFLRTHPITSDRIADTAARADTYPPITNRDQTDFFHIRARIRALFSSDPNTTAQRFASNLEAGKFENQQAERYGYALALSKSNRHQDALTQINKLLNSTPDSSRYQIARANILLFAGQFEQALQQFQTTYDNNSKDWITTLYYASALIKTKQYQQAKNVLKNLIIYDKTEPRSYSLLARAEGELGNSLAAHQALAEYHYLRANLVEAQRQLKLAEKYVGSSEYAKASVEARIVDIQEEMQRFDEKPKPSSSQ